MKQCPNCEQDNADSRHVCWECGASLVPPAKDENDSDMLNKQSVSQTPSSINSGFPSISSDREMKRCPYCAEDIYVEAVLCRYCNRSIGPSEGSEITEEQKEFARLLHRTDTLLSTLKQLGPKDIQNYPLSVNRRADVITNFVSGVEERDRELDYKILPLYWQVGANPKTASQWRDLIGPTLPDELKNQISLMEDEALLATAIILSRAITGDNKYGVTMIDWIRQWKGLKKAQRADRLLRGLFIGGAISNLLSSPKKLPKEGTLQWNVCRRAYAQVEALIILNAQ